MKKAAIALSLLVLLLVMPHAASAAPPEPGSFTTTGYTTIYEFETLPSGRTKFYLEAVGESGPKCAYWFPDAPDACGVSGDLNGTFTFVEWGNIDLDPLTQEGSGKGTNHGILTISSLDGQLTIRFDGRTDSQFVWGNFRILSGSGEYANLHGQGKYDGNAGLAFIVTYEGRFHTAPH